MLSKTRIGNNVIYVTNFVYSTLLFNSFHPTNSISDDWYNIFGKKYGNDGDLLQR